MWSSSYQSVSKISNNSRIGFFIDCSESDVTKISESLKICFENDFRNFYFSFSHPENNLESIGKMFNKLITSSISQDITRDHMWISLELPIEV